MSNQINSVIAQSMFPGDDSDDQFCRGLLTYILDTATLGPILIDYSGDYWFDYDPTKKSYRVTYSKVKCAIPRLMRQLRGETPTTWTEYLQQANDTPVQAWVLAFFKYMLIHTVPLVPGSGPLDCSMTGVVGVYESGNPDIKM